MIHNQLAAGKYVPSDVGLPEPDDPPPKPAKLLIHTFVARHIASDFGDPVLTVGTEL